MNELGVFTPDQARRLWQDYQSRQQMLPTISQNYPQRRPSDEVSPHRVFVTNSEAEAIPAYACMRIIGTETVGGRTALTVEKPTALDGEFVFNSQYEIAAGATGWAYRYGIVVMQGDGTAPTDANVTYSPVVGEWTVTEDAGPFIVFGTHNAVTDAVIGRVDTGSNPILVGFVTKCLGRGWHEVRVEDWEPDVVEDPWGDCNCCDDTIECGSGSEFGSGSSAVDECGTSLACGETVEQLGKYNCDNLDGCGAVPMDRGAELAGYIVRVHSCGQLPMRVGGMVRLTKWVETASYIHRANSGSGFVDPWRGKYYLEVGRGERPLIRQTNTTYAMCVDELTGVCTVIETGTASYLVEHALCCPTVGDTCEGVEPSGAPA